MIHADPTVDYPLGPQWPVISWLGVSPWPGRRQRYPEGMGGAWEHWLVSARAFDAAGGGGIRAAAREWLRRHEPPAAPEPLPAEFMGQLLVTLARDADLRRTLRNLLEDAA